jgi:hypothetical protein
VGWTEFPAPDFEAGDPKAWKETTMNLLYNGRKEGCIEQQARHCAKPFDPSYCM